MENKPYHHLEDGRFRNPEGSPVRDMKFNWSYKIFNEERKKIKIEFPDDHLVPRVKVLENLKKISENLKNFGKIENSLIRLE